MKKTLSVILSALILFGSSALFVPAYAEGTGLIGTSAPELNIISPLAIVQSVTGENAYRDVLAGEGSPCSILVDAADVGDFEEFFNACIEASAIPNVRVSDEAQADAVADASDALGFQDVTIISSDAELISRVRERVSAIRTGLCVSLPNGAMTSKEAAQIRSAVRGAPATFCVIDPEYATPANVRELQSLALAVWVTADSGDAVSVVRAAASGINGMIVTDAEETVRILNLYFDPGTLARTPLIIGHRGYEDVAPENTIPAFRAALENGADTFEIDVHISKDGHVIVRHDGSINTTTDYDGSLPIGEMTLEEILRYNIVSGVYYPGKYKVGEVTDLKVPTLEEVLELRREYPGHRVFIEIKGDDAATVAGTARIVKEYGMEDRVDVISFNGYLLGQMQLEENLPGMSTGLLGGFGSPGTAEEVLADLLSAIRNSQNVNSTINNSGTNNKLYLFAANDRGMTIWPWTYGTSSNDRAFLIGSAGITTSDPGWAGDMLRAIAAGDAEVGVGRKIVPGVYGITYKGDEVPIAPNKVDLKVVSGDAVSVSNGRITGETEGEAEIVCSVMTKTASGSEYVLACGPVRVTVTAEGPGVDRDEPEIDPEDPAEPIREGDELFVSHLNSYNEYVNDAMIVTDTGEIRTVSDVEGASYVVMRKYIMYAVENIGGRYIATKYETGDDAAGFSVPDPIDGFLLYLCPLNRSYSDAKGGRLLGREFETDGFVLYRPFGYDSSEDPDNVRRLYVSEADAAASDLTFRVKQGDKNVTAGSVSSALRYVSGSKYAAIFSIYDEKGRDAYELRFDGSGVTDPSVSFNMNVTVGGAESPSLGAANSRLLEKGYTTVDFRGSGALPGTATVSVPTELSDGEYALYRFDKKKGVLTAVGGASVKDGVAAFSVGESANYVVAPACTDHEYETEVTPPTCTEGGFTTYTCRICLETFRDDFVKATGHDYETAVTAPTCTEDGFTTYACKNCSEVKVGDRVAATGHNFGESGAAIRCFACGAKNPGYREQSAFSDVPPGAYYAKAVKWATSYDVTRGTAAGTFSPDAGCTRAQVVTFMWRAVGAPEPETGKNPFTDVKEGDYFYKAVLWAVENGITAGTGKKTFSPDSVCTRGQIVTFLYRQQGSPATKGLKNPFSDVERADYYHKAVLWAVGSGVTAGKSAKSFAPSDVCTRAQIVTFLYRAVK